MSQTNSSPRPHQGRSPPNTRPPSQIVQRPAGYPPQQQTVRVPQGGSKQGSPTNAQNSAFQPPNRRPVNGYEQAPQQEKVYLQEPESFKDENRVLEDDEVSIDFLLDDPRDMTWGRRIALVLSNFSCYNPAVGKKNEIDESVTEEETSALKFKDFSASRPGAVGAYPFTESKKEIPSLAKAWAYFEHFALPRYVVSDGEGLDSAEPGEEHLPTKLYNPFCTPHKQLGDWGLGVGLYFTTLRALCILTFLGGIVSIPNIIYFSSDDYSGGQEGVRAPIKGSAICTDTTWVLCTDCKDNEYPDGRIGYGINVESGANETFAQRNNCDGATIEQGMINLGALALISVGLLIMNFTIKRVEVQFDIDEQTAQDYSIVVANPPLDAYDPAEWRKFFYQKFGAYVTTCTVGVDNDLLVNSLVERREKLKLIESKLEPGTSLDTLTLAAKAAEEEEGRGFVARTMAKLSPGIPELVGRLVVLNSRIQGLAQQNKPVSNVFVTFETEADQRKVLDSLLNRRSVGNQDLLFRGKHSLKVKEPDEPNTIRWQDLNEKSVDRAKQQLYTTLATLVAIVVVALLVRLINDWNVVYASFGVAIANVIFPQFAKVLTSLESHHSEGTKQRSLYFKIALFRWVNTAIVITIITDFTKTLSDTQGLIAQIYSLFFAEIVTTNALQLSDIGGHISRHFSAPRAKSQDAMNLSFQGSEVQLAERYTNMTKILFLALWYCSIYPAALFLCSVALLINYYTDRFSLMRTWKRIPHLGPGISLFSRHYFFPLAATAMAVLSSYFWASFPFDNLCEMGNETVGEALSGEWFVDPKGDDDNVTVTVNATSPAIMHCRQDFFRFYKGDWNRFPFSAENQPEGMEWMTEDQEDLTAIWSWVAVGFLGGLLIIYFLGIFRKFCCKPKYRARGDDQNINFSEVATISSYIPQVNSPIFSYPLVACSIDNIDDELFDWDDPDRPYEYYDLTKDAKYLMEGLTDVSESVTFSQIAHWPPPKNEQVEM